MAFRVQCNNTQTPLESVLSPTDICQKKADFLLISCVFFNCLYFVRSVFCAVTTPKTKIRTNKRGKLNIVEINSLFLW